MPRVSVVVPLYQTERYIAEALASVLAQTFADFECIVVDDGSRDRGPEIARATGDARVRVVSQQNRGLAGARNTGIREARGEYVAFLDADDRWAPEKLARHVAVLDGDPSIGVTCSASRLIDDDGNPLGLTQSPARQDFSASYIFCRNPVGNGSSPVIRKAVFDDIAFEDAALGRTCWFDESFRQSEDIECWTRIAVTTAWKFAYVDAALTDYRVNTVGLSANTGKQLETWQRFRAKVKGYAPELEASFGDLAEAYQLRYLARRAVRGSGPERPALAMMTRAIRLSPRILLAEPARTMVTLAASIAQRVLPQALFEKAGTIAMSRMSHMTGVRT